MNKAELVTKMKDRCEGQSKKQVEEVLNAFIDVVTETLANGEKIQLVGFGTYEVRHRAARTGRNPRNPQETIHIEESKAPVFKAGKILKEACNK